MYISNATAVIYNPHGTANSIGIAVVSITNMAQMLWVSHNMNVICITHMAHLSNSHCIAVLTHMAQVS
jgi:hypothetical protein